MKRKPTMQYIYIVLTILLPVLSIYISPIPGADLGTVCVLLFSVCMFFNRPRVRVYPFLIAVLLYTFIVTIPAITGYSEWYSSRNSIIFRLFRFTILLIAMIGLGFTNYYDENLFTGLLKIASLIVAGYAIIQSIVFQLLGIKLRNIFGPEKGGAIFSASLGEYEKVYRPPSFFLEPSAVTYYLTPILCYILFHQKKTSFRDIIVATVVSIGILVSTSGQGLLVIVLCWGIWSITQIRTMKIGGIIIVVVCAILFFKNYDIGYTVSRITTQDELNAVEARAGGYDLVREMDPRQTTFGNGYGNYVETTYYSSFAEIIFCTGYFGLAVIVLMYLAFFIKGYPYQKVLVLASFLLMIGGGIYTATYLCLYLPLLLPFKKDNRV